MANNVLKDKDEQILNPVIPRYETHLEDGESPVKTGRKVNGKDEYVFRRNIGNLPNNSSMEYLLPIQMENITVTRALEIYATSADYELIPMPRYTGSSYINYYISRQSGTNLPILAVITNSNLSRFTCYFNMYFTYNS